MTAEEFRQTAIKVVGSKPGWQRRIAVKLDIRQATVSRYATGVLTVPQLVAVALEALLNPDRPHPLP
jgi:hypothetical protein